MHYYLLQCTVLGQYVHALLVLLIGYLQLLAGTPGLEFIWLANDLHCENLTVYKKEGGELDVENVDKAYVDACSSYEEGSRGFFAFRVEEGSRTVNLEVFNASCQLHFICMKNKTVVQEK